MSEVINLDGYEKIKTNRKSTNGRRIYYQRVNKYIRNKKGDILSIIKTNKVIKHLQVSPHRLSITPKMIDVYDKLNRRTPTSNPNTIKRKAERNRTGRLIWDSSKDGTYIRKLHGKLT